MYDVQEEINLKDDGKKYERKNSFLCRIMIASLLRIVKFNKNGAERRRDSSCEPEIQREAFMC